MKQASLDHPSAEQLAAFGLGRLDEVQSATIEEHLSACDTCCDIVDKVSPDSLVHQLKAAPEPFAIEGVTETPSGNQAPLAEAATMAGADYAPARPAEGTATEPASHSTLSDIPSELANHPRYRIQELLGTGGMGAVYKAEHRLMRRTVALKVINAKFMQSKQAVERFRREVEAAGRLQHPNIVHSHDAEQAGDLHYLVMEYVPGTDLSKVLEERGPLPVAEACEYIRQAALGLQHAHESGMVHRDIKPQNLMVTFSRDATAERGASRSAIASRLNDVVKILDFGLASLTTEVIADEPGNQPSTFYSQKSGLTQAGSLMGTPDYMAPEQGRDARTADIRSDIYSLGCTLYTLLAGTVPFPGGTAIDKVIAHASNQAEPIRQLRPDVPAALVQVLDKMMAKDPAARYQTPAEVAVALAPVANAPGAPRAVRSRRRQLAGALTIAAGLALLALGIVYYLQTPEGVIRFEIDDPEIKVVIDQAGPTITGADVKPIGLKPGKHGMTITRGDFKFNTTTFHLNKGERTILKIDWLPGDKIHVMRDGLKIDVLEPLLAAMTDEQRIQGTWRPVAGANNEFAGGALSNEELQETMFTFRGESLQWDIRVGKELMRVGGTFTLDGRKAPGRLTFLIQSETILDSENKLLKGSKASRSQVGQGLRGIYRFDGERLVLCTTHAADTWPDKFTTSKDTGDQFLFHLERQGAGAPKGPAANAPFNAVQAKAHQDAWAKHLGALPEITNTIGMKLRLIPPGKFTHPKLADDRPEGSKEVNQPFYAGAHEVTVGQFRQFVKETGYKTKAEDDPLGGVKVLGGHPLPRGTERNKAYFWNQPDFDDELPVGYMTWHDAMAFCRWLGKKENRTYRLPTEVESHWLARAGSTGRHFFGDDFAKMEDYSWHSKPAAPLDRPKAVGLKRPNPWGLFDVHGNVSELIYEWTGTAGLEVAEGGPGPDNPQIHRGGSYADAGAADTGSIGNFRGMVMSHIGFRVVLVGEPVRGAPAKSDEDLLQGVWKIVSVEQAGQTIPMEVMKKSPLITDYIIRGNDWGAVTPDEKNLQNSFKIIRRTDPKEIDVEVALFEGMPDVRGIYKLEGDTFTVCVNEPGQKRPTEFTTKGNPDHIMIVARRATPAELGWVPLFNGKDLTGWRVPALKNVWSVEDGLLVGRGIGTNLVNEREFSENFDLRCEAKIGAEHWGQVKMRLDADGTGYGIPIRGLYWAQGVNKITNSTGTPRPPADVWFDYEISARGPDVKIKINGSVVAHLSGLTVRRGRLALETIWPAPSATIQFRKIEIKELPATFPVKTDEERIQGAWRPVSGEYSGKPLTAEQLKRFKLAFKDETVQLSMPAGTDGKQSIHLGATFSLDARKEPKRLIIIVQSESPFPKGARSQVGQAGKCIYRFVGERLEVVFAGGDEKQPTKFGSTETPDQIWLTLERQGAAPKSDKELILGNWKPLSAEAFGTPVPQELIDLMQPTITFTPDKLTAKVNLDKMPVPVDMLKKLLIGFDEKEKTLSPKELATVMEKQGVEAAYTIDPTKTPRTINISYLSPVRKTLLGIYSLEGDTLKICVAVDPERAEERPTVFTAGPGVVVGTLKRLKE